MRKYIKPAIRICHIRMTQQLIAFSGGDIDDSKTTDHFDAMGHDPLDGIDENWAFEDDEFTNKNLSAW
ncbi:MAG: hypothetical protein HUK03_10055 [Bacteroidaceae bacterium]|nr:hypothetical protein [Bacteroidaceae bacterium]